MGNTLSKTTCETTTYTYNQNNQLITETTSGVQTQYFYDANGNTVEQTNGTDVVIYDYDDQNRLIYLDTGTSIISYEYDAKGIRVAKTVDGEEENYLVDHLQAYAQVLEETDAAGVLQARYTQGNDLLAMNRGSDVSYYHYDALGSTRALTDASGVLTDVYDYEAYGEILQSSGTTENAFLFTGEQRDPESGHYYLRARYYDPSMGRFVTRDTWEGDSRRPMSLNKYIYTEGNPVVFVDPSGHFVGTLSAATAVQAVLLELIETAMPSFDSFIRTVVGSDERELTSGERGLLQTIYGASIFYDKVRIRRGGLPTIRGDAVAMGNLIRFPSKDYEKDFSTTGKLGTEAWFVHEACHVWQNQNVPGYHWSVVLIAEHIPSILGGSDPYFYVLDPKKKLIDYGYEQQADIVADYYRWRHQGRDVTVYEHVIYQSIRR